MSKKNRKNRVRQTDIARPDSSAGSLINTFAGAKGLDIRNANDLMNWIVFGDPKERFDYSTESNTF